MMRASLRRGQSSREPLTVTKGQVRRARWLARAAFVLWLAAAANMVGLAGRASVAMSGLGAAGACLVLAGGYMFLAHRRVARWLAFGVVVLAPVAVLVIFAWHHLLWVAVVAVVLVWLAIAAARLALVPATPEPGMAARDVPPPKRAFLIMNPRSGGREGRQVRAERQGRGPGR
jgi:hypothetical protein